MIVIFTNNYPEYRHYIDVLRRLRDADSKKCPPKIENHQLVSTSRQCSRTPGGLVTDFLASPIFSCHGSANFYLFSGMKSVLRRLFFCDAKDVIEKCDGRAEKTFTKWLPEMFSTFLPSLIEVYSGIGRLYCSKCSLHECILSYLSEIKGFR